MLSAVALFKTPEALEKDFFLAVLKGQLDEVKEKFSKNKMNVNCANAEGYTPLHIAAKNGHVTLCEWLLDQGAYINAANPEGGVVRGSFGTYGVRTEDKKIEIKVQENGNGQTPLHLAVESNFLDVARLLLNRGARVDGKDIRDRTPLYFAIGLEHTEMVALLVQFKADIHAPAGKLGCSFLNRAVNSGNLEIVKLLIENGADINDRRGIYGESETAMHMAVEDEKKEILEYLLEKGADTNIINSRNQTPLQLTKYQNYEDLLYEFGKVGRNYSI